MKCPHCNGWTEVRETRKRTNGAVYRRHECGSLHRFSTLDGVVVRVDLIKRGAGRPPARHA